MPELVVFLPDTHARCCDTHWCGGPDFAVEIVSPHDRSREKLGFYASVGVRELLIVDRDPRSIEMHRLRDGQLASVGTGTPAGGSLVSDVLPLSFRRVPGQPRPRILITHQQTGQSWEA